MRPLKTIIAGTLVLLAAAPLTAQTKAAGNKKPNILFIMGDDVANAALNFLERGWNGENFHEVTENLRSSDPYMVMADFKDYRRAQADLQRLYADRQHWAKMSLKNIANSGIFSADRAVLDYARDIWHASAVK